jgi:hypothetical protein
MDFFKKTFLTKAIINMYKYTLISYDDRYEDYKILQIK